MHVAHMEQKLQGISTDWAKRPTWRMLPKDLPQIDSNSDEKVADQWAISKREASSIRLFDVDYAELADIAGRYQNAKDKPVICNHTPLRNTANNLSDQGYGGQLHLADSHLQVL